MWRLFPHGLDESLLCTQGFQNEEGVFSGPCKGDSGSPLTASQDGRDTLVGIVSGGIGCGLGVPAWYTRVFYYIEWIDCIVRESIKNNSNKKMVENACERYAKA